MKDPIIIFASEATNLLFCLVVKLLSYNRQVVVCMASELAKTQLDGLFYENKESYGGNLDIQFAHIIDRERIKELFRYMGNPVSLGGIIGVVGRGGYSELALVDNVNFNRGMLPKTVSEIAVVCVIALMGEKIIGEIRAHQQFLNPKMKAIWHGLAKNSPGIAYIGSADSVDSIASLVDVAITRKNAETVGAV